MKDRRAVVERVLSLDLRSLALFRIGTALIILWDLLRRIPNAVAHYSDDGVLPRWVVLSDGNHDTVYSLHMLSGEARFELALFAVAFIFGVALLFGWQTRLAAFFSWILLLSLHKRNPYVLHGGDALLRIGLFWGLFLPWGERFSLDARRRAGALKGNVVFSAATAALIWQFFLLYWFAVLHKLRGAAWREGYAVYLSVNIDVYAREAGRWLAHHPALMKWLTYAVLFVEFAAPPLLVSPWGLAACRIAAVVSMWALHVGMGTCLDLTIFPWASSVLMLAFVPTELWDRFTATRGGAAPGARLRDFPQNRPVWHALVLALAAYVTVSNVATIPRFKAVKPEALRAAGHASLDQNWSMFAPTPMRSDGWYVMVATLADGTRMDIFREQAPVDWQAPKKNVIATLGPQWQEFLGKGLSKKKPLCNLAFSNYLVKRWEKGKPPSKRVRQVEIFYVYEKTPLPGEPVKAKKVKLFQHAFTD